MNEDFLVSAGEFEGPLDLLLSLIEKRKLHISDVSLAEITDAYMQYIEAFEAGEEKESHKDMADFVFVAATLMLIKSLALLPSLQPTPEEESAIHDLEDRLQEYAKIKERARLLAERFGPLAFLPRGELKAKSIVFAPSNDLSLSALRDALLASLASIPKKELLPKRVIQRIVSLEEVVSNLISRVQENFSLRFRDFTGGTAAKVDVIVSFLAMLELVRRGAVLATQAEHFGEIDLQVGEASVPRYGM